MTYFFFFSSRRRHTRYWRDWSSDVCSSDLADPLGRGGRDPGHHGGRAGLSLAGRGHHDHGGRAAIAQESLRLRSGERRVGEEWRSRGSPYHLKKKKEVVQYKLNPSKYLSMR